MRHHVSPGLTSRYKIRLSQLVALARKSRLQPRQAPLISITPISAIFMKIAALVLATAVMLFASVSCDTHPWEETQVLHEGMHKAHGGAGHETGHGDAHHGEAKKDAAHATPEAHAAPAPAHAAEAPKH